MEKLVIKFNFVTPVHFGGQNPDLSVSDCLFQSDSLFSAMVIEANKLDGQKGVDKIYDICKNKCSFSSMMPFIGEDYLLPKPLVYYDRVENDDNKDKTYAKQVKKMQFIPASSFSLYIESIKNGTPVQAKEYNNLIKQLGEYDVLNKVRIPCVDDEKPEPYHVGTFTFSKEAGSYVIMIVEDKDSLKYIKKVLVGLSYDGLGGRRSSGYGKFEFEIISLNENNKNRHLSIINELLDKQSTRYMTVSMTMFENLNDEMLKNSYYLLARRSGFISSSSYSKNLMKKNDSYAFVPGSTFIKKEKGIILDVSNKAGSHPIYKYYMPLYLGVD